MNFTSEEQSDKAKLEDLLVEMLYDKYRGLIFHGGTAIWRCYSGNRFSRDIDFYLDAKDNESIFREISGFLKDNGFVLKEKGYDRTTNTMHFLVEAVVKMKIDINLKRKEGVPVDYVRIDGSKMVVLSLTPEELLNEKIAAYKDKMHGKSEFKQSEVQDLYDICYLTTIVKKRVSNTVKELSALIEEVEKSPPPNVRSLDHLILSGVPPTFDFMVGKIRGWVHGD
jgi:predicted nucleotidyltransferase component of viral defense system